MSSERSYDVIQPEGGVPIKAWTRGVPLEEAAARQLANVARLPFIHRWVAAMPDVHHGKGATVGSVIPTVGAIIPAAVGVDIGCGMMAVRTSLAAKDLPDDLKGIRSAIERAVPHGRTNDGGPLDRHPKLGRGQSGNHLGTLGTGNHFIEVCLDQDQRVWFLLHSGSRGVGN